MNDLASKLKSLGYDVEGLFEIVYSATGSGIIDECTTCTNSCSDGCSHSGKIQY